MTTENLWPSDIADIKAETPLSILRAQANALTQVTRGVVSGEVETAATDRDPWGVVINMMARRNAVETGEAPDLVPTRTGFRHSFYVVAPALKNYRHLLLEVWHDITLYPIMIKSASDHSKWAELADEKQFKANLRAMLATDYVRRSVSALVSQSIV